MASKFSLYNSISSVLLSKISKQMNLIHLSFLFHKKLLIIKHILNFYNTPNHKITFLQIYITVHNDNEPNKQNSSETPITTLTHILHCYDRTHKLLQTLDLDSQRITQSSQAIQSALETITTLFNSTNLH